MSDENALPPIALPEAIGDAINGAIKGELQSWKPVALAYVDDAGKPKLSFRGSLALFNETQLTLWARSAEGGLVKALAQRPDLSLLFADWNPQAPIYLSMTGRGQLVDDPAFRDRVYENLPQNEKDHDKERKGVAILIDVDWAMFMLDGKFTQMGTAGAPD